MEIDNTAFGLRVFDVIVQGKRKGRGEEPPGKEMGYRVFYDVDIIGTSKVVTSIPILPGHYSYD